MGLYAMYLRKSRADAEAEASGAGETLARHQHMLEQLADKMDINISKVYKEIVSGETIAARPVMQQLLTDVETGIYDGVLVVEVERLARGDTIDQGIVSQTFKYSDTNIITPTKIYNPNNEFDEEYFEFGLFMSRREYKTINRRIQAGRVESIKEGKYPGNKTPFGYERVKLHNEKGFTLAIKEPEASAVRIIYDMYVNERSGTTTIAKTLNSMGYKPLVNNIFTSQSIASILDNPVYAGYVAWNRRKEVKIMQNGTVHKSRPRNYEYLKCKGRHEAIISEELWNKANEIRTNKRISSPRKNKELTNPLCGLIICSKCGNRMQRRPAGNRQPADVIMCANPECNNRASYMSLIENRILDGLGAWLNNYDITPCQESELQSNINAMEYNITSLEKEYTVANSQLNKAYDFLEQGIYATDEFRLRSAAIKTKLSELEASITSVKNEIEAEKQRQEAKINFIPKIKNIIECYNDIESPKSKNDMLKEVIDKIEYTKDVKGRGHEDEFILKIYPVTK